MALERVTRNPVATPVREPTNRWARPQRGAVCSCAHPVHSHFGPTNRGPCSVRGCTCYGA